MAVNGAVFDEIQRKSGGIVNGTAGVSDFVVTDLCATLAVSEGNDVLDAGSGNDWLNGGGDTGSYALCSKGSGNLLKNGGFETVAGDAAQQENGAGYLTEGGVANTIDFGWTVADPATNIEIQMGCTGGLAPFAGTYKLERQRLGQRHQRVADRRGRRGRLVHRQGHGPCRRRR
jgi:Ca2+-binding RTX toxin-like protein